jgi:hypothetical protein
MNFQHLNKPQSDAQAYGFSGRRMQRMRQLQQSVEEEELPECPHSDAHLIAVSKEAKQNPIQAFHLIAEGIPHQQAIARLKAALASSVVLPVGLWRKFILAGSSLMPKTRTWRHSSTA